MVSPPCVCADVGDSVAVDDLIVVIETDKVAVEVRAQVNGTLSAQHAEASAMVEVGKPLYTIAAGGAGAAKAAPAPAKASAPAAAAAAPAPAAPAAAAAAQVQKVPSMGDSITQGKILEWKKGE